MADTTAILTQARKARFDDLISFGGNPSEDVERFLKSIKNITKATDESTNLELLEIVRGKLTQSAGIWFDNNETKFKKWSDFETAFRTRYFSTTITPKKFEQLKQRQQKPDESITSYCDEIINLCREVDPVMSDSTIIQYLLSGLNTYIRKELSRRESAMDSLGQFLKYAKIEQDLHDTFDKTATLSLDPNQPYFDHHHQLNPSLTATIYPHKPIQRNTNQNDYQRQTQSSDSQQNSRSGTKYPPRTSINTTKKYLQNDMYQQETNTFHPTASTQHTPCKICHRKNHRTIDCFHKQPNGCFKCGGNHMIRNCHLLSNFQ